MYFCNLSVLIYLFLFIFFLFSSFDVNAKNKLKNYKINALSGAHWCLINESGLVSSGCSGPKLIDDNLNIYSDFYKNISNKPYSLGWNNKKRMVPVLSFATLNVPLNMVTSNNLITGPNAFDYKLENPIVYYWNNISKVIYFGGSESDGQVLLPTPGWVKTAHKNGAKVFGAIFLSPSAYGGDDELTQIKYMLADGTYKLVADQLAKIAIEYGIDGYFINMEAPYPDGITSDDLTKFSNYLHIHKLSNQNNLEVELYYVSGSTGPKMFSSSDSVFVDYNLCSDGDGSISKAISSGYLSSQVEFGLDQVYSDIGCLNAAISKNASLARFDYQGMMSPTPQVARNPVAQYDNATKFWERSEYQQFKNTNNHRYSGNGLLTNFNPGIGNNYYINGESKNFGFWSELGLQDVLPDLDSDVIRYKVKSDFIDTSYLDFSQAFMGGASYAVVYNKSDPNYEFPLYTGVNIANNKNYILSVVYKYSNSFNLGDISLCVSGNYSKCLSLDGSKGNIRQSNWFKSDMSVGDIGNIQEIYLINNTNINNDGKKLKINIGQIYIGPDFSLQGVSREGVSNIKISSPVSKYNSKTQKLIGNHYILTWDITNPDKSLNMLSGYDVYYIKNDGSEVFYGASFQNIMDVMIPGDIGLNNSANAICVYPEWYYHDSNLSYLKSNLNCVSI